MNKSQSSRADKSQKSPIFQPILRVDQWEGVRSDAREISKIILVLLASGVVITSALVAPGATGAVAKLLLPWQDQPWRRHRIRDRLKKKEYITLERKNGQWLYKLTPKGQKIAEQTSFDIIEIKRPLRWDRKWRIVVFDIPERKRDVRTILRKKLKLLDFKKVQQSVWILPWPCREEILFMRELYDLESYLTFWEVADNDDFTQARIAFQLDKSLI